MKAIIWLKGALVGAGVMYFFDPERGRRRRALLRDQAVHTLNEVGDTIDIVTRDFNNRAGGLLADVRGLLSSDPVSDATLAARIRSRIGHTLTHPKAIRVSARNGFVTLGGTIAAEEIDALFRCTAMTRGVVGIENDLVVLAPGESAAYPAAMGDLSAGGWNPTTCLLAGAAGSLLALYGKGRGGLVGSAVSTVGLGLLARSISNTNAPKIARRPHGGPTARAAGAPDPLRSDADHMPREAHAV